jgi:hypothetical protein
MTGINSTVTGKFSDPPVIMTGVMSRFISRPGSAAAGNHPFVVNTETLLSLHERIQ